MNTGIYQIRNRVNDKVYIGSAVNLKARLHGHRGGLNRGEHHNAHLQSAWRKYGADAFEFRVLLFCDKSDLYFYEQRCIDRCDAVNKGYNKSPNAGTSLGRKMRPESISKMAESKRGKKRSPETRAKHSATCADPVYRARLSAACKGTHSPTKTPEHVRKVALANTGKVRSPEMRAKLRAANLGKKNGPHTDATRLKISLALRGRTLTGEHLAAVRLGQQRRRERERLAKGIA
jgi:group I intron endonuclease